jgi:DNA-binding CsgD family transcriptional regulator
MFPRLWRARDELSPRNIRRSHLCCTFLFPLAITCADTVYRDWDIDPLGLDSILLQTVCYGLAWLLLAFLPKTALPSVLRGGAVLGSASTLAVLLLSLILHMQGLFILVLAAVAQFLVGLAAAAGFYVFGFVNRNAERWLAVMAIGLYYSVSWVVASMPFFEVISTVLAMVIAVLLSACALTVQRQTLLVGVDASAPPDVRREPAGVAGTTGGGGTVEDAGATDGATGGGAAGKTLFVPVLLVVFYLINFANYYLEAEGIHIDDLLYACGMVAGLAVCALVQMFLNRSVWHLWNLYLFGTIIGIVIIAAGGSAAGVLSAVCSALYGAADMIGYLAVLYLVGGAAKIDGRYRYFRVVCVCAFVFAACLPPAVDLLFASAGPSPVPSAFALIVICVGLCILIQPLLHRQVFASDWIDNLDALDSSAYWEELQGVEQTDRLEGLGLTTREKQVCALLLTAMTPRMIAQELGVSVSTCNFHSTNLYRKLKVQSRVQLMERFL